MVSVVMLSLAPIHCLFCVQVTLSISLVRDAEGNPQYYLVSPLPMPGYASVTPTICGTAGMLLPQLEGGCGSVSFASRREVELVRGTFGVALPGPRPNLARCRLLSPLPFLHSLFLLV
jgi:hypothetical protein